LTIVWASWRLTRCAAELLRQDAQQDPVILASAFEVSSFGYFQRSGCGILPSDAG
jgi:hypothetical protein